MTLQEAQKAVDDWIHKYGVRYFSELTNMTVLTEEVGELARLIAREYGDQSFKPGSEPNDIKEEISKELADILFVIICLANQMNVNLEDALTKSIEKKTLRDEDRHQKNQKLRQ